MGYIAGQRIVCGGSGLKTKANPGTIMEILLLLGQKVDVEQIMPSNPSKESENLDPYLPDGPDPVIPKDPTHLTVHQIRACAPLSVRKNITKRTVVMINAGLDNNEAKTEFRENVLSWINVMQEGKWKMEHYVNACKYVTFKLMGDTQQAAWVKVFPERYQRLIDKGVSGYQIAGHVSMYNKTDIVIKITERTLPPLHVINSDLLQEAINKQATLMRTAKSETVQMKAASVLIENLKAPESLKVNLNVGVTNDTVENFREITRALAVQQKKMIESGGMTAKGVAEMAVIEKAEKVIEAEFTEMEPDRISILDPTKDFFQRSAK